MTEKCRSSFGLGNALGIEIRWESNYHMITCHNRQVTSMYDSDS